MHKYTPEQQHSIFWSRIDKSGGDDACWIWTGRLEHGYGRTKWFGADTYAHRITFALAYGPIPDGLCVLHNCPTGDNPACCNPAHLWLGTKRENNTDRSMKGRNHADLRRNERNGRAKLLDAQVIEIRALYASGLTQKEIAARFSVSNQQVSNIVRGVNRIVNR